MRILVLSHELPPVGGGGGRVAQDICQGLVERGHEVRIITAHLKGLPREETIDGVRVFRLASGRHFPFRADLIEMAIYDVVAVASGLRMIREWQPDLIHAHFAVPAGAAAYVLSRLTGVPYVITAHLGDVPGGVPEKTERWFRWVYPFTAPIYRSAAKVVAVSEFTRQLAQAHYPVDIDIIPNGVDLRGLPARVENKNGAARIVFVGRLVPQKNPQHVVTALAALQDLPWKCTLLGDGPLRKQVEMEIDRHGLEDRFTMPGWVAPQDVLSWYAKSDILLLPSRSEGLPVVGVQALAMGLALVLSTAGGNVELVKNGENGFLFDPGDIDTLVSGLRILLGDPQRLLKASKHSLELAKRFDIELVVKQYEALFEQIIGKAKGQSKES
jgi:glycosyltransferase involved in cell wall biosynthesis